MQEARKKSGFLPLSQHRLYVKFSGMTTLAEIQAAIDALPARETQDLLVYVAARLKAQGVALPEAHAVTRDQRIDWMAEDEAAMRRFHPNA
jgi:hypothetical protein